MKAFYYFVSISITLILSACAARKPFYHPEAKPVNSFQTGEDPGIPDELVEYEVFLVGDLWAESNPLNSSSVIQAISSQLKPDVKKQGIVFLGNLFGESGFPAEEDPTNTYYSDTKNCLQSLKERSDQFLVIPGNYEWFDGANYTVNSVQEFEELMEEMMEGDNIVATKGGCGEPEVVKLTEQLILILIDSQWLLQGDDSEERKRSGCGIDDEIEFITALSETISDYKGKNIVIATHHPVYSNGLTGGNYPATSHLVPLPVLGTVITGAKILLGSEQQFGHPAYEAYRAALMSALTDFEGITVVSSHDHNLQYFQKNQNHFVTAGSGSLVEYVRKGGDATFAYMSEGFAKITHTRNNEVWLQLFAVNETDNSTPTLVFTKKIHLQENPDTLSENPFHGPESQPDFVTAKASDLYSKKILGMGDMYREEWGTDVRVPVLLLDEVDGGLKPVKLGGGFQTKTLRLENPEGKQYVIRSVDKESTKSIPIPLRNTFIQQIIQDGTAAAHPYGALAIPSLADAAKIYHSNPRIVWVPSQKALGSQNTEFAEKLYLFEERPGGNTSDIASFGRPDETVNTLELIQKLENNHKHKVDREMYLRARLFDLLIGDWDRHEDQWRWGVFESSDDPEITIYKPIPRDRDQVFFKNDGFFNYMVSRSWFNPKLQKFDLEIKNLPGITKNAGHLDRILLSPMTKEDFVNTARYLKNQLTDSVVENALRDIPEEIRQISGDEIVLKLKQRRNDLDKYAGEYYYHLSKEITVTGTEGKNLFEIQTLEGNQLDIKVYHLTSDGIRYLIWQRKILGEETNELRLFGLKKSDEFHFSGEFESSIKIRLIGGGGKDSLYNGSRTNKILVYDKPDGISISGNPVRLKTADRRGINRYDRTDWRLNRSFHFPMLSFYTDEGIGISYNVWWNTFGFRSDPYKSIHALSISFYLSNSALIANYSGHWPNALGYEWDFRLDAIGKGPAFTQYFYGLGNEYTNFGEVFPDIVNSNKTSFHIVKGIQAEIRPSIVRDLPNGQSISITPGFEFLNLNNEPEEESRFIFTDEANVPFSDFGSKLYASVGLYYHSKRLNHEVIPTRGFDFMFGTEFRQSLRNSDYSNLTFTSNTSVYIPFSPEHSVVLAMNLGGSYTLGDYEFFHANYLSNHSRLRGYRINRFAGDAILYHSTDLRIQLTEGRGPFRTSLGIFGSFDYGRAFLEDEEASDWHTSFGGGIFLTPLDLAGLTIGYHIGRDDRQLRIGGSLVF